MTKTETQNIPLLDIHAQDAPIKDRILKKIHDMFDKKQFINGPEVSELEDKLKNYCETQFSVGVSSGSDALIISLMALNIGHHDEVITTPFSFFATAGSIARVGAKPVFCDIDPKTFNIDPLNIEEKITENTKAIMPVHLFGQCADMDPIIEIAKKYNLYIIEDAAQAIGSSYNTNSTQIKKAGNLGTIGCFSFFPSKNLGGCGDGGAVTTNDEELYQKLKSLRMHGETQRYHHKFIGGNFRLDTLQAGILSIKLDYLNKQHEGRMKNAEYYNKHLHPSVIKPFINEKCTSIFNQYTLQSKDRDTLKSYLTDHTIGNNIYYPIPLHLQECFHYLNHKEGDFPYAEKAAKEVLSIPVFSELSTDQLDYVIHHINHFHDA
ncbi:transcriptional regulator [Candidatus Marinamargulisbacteria bacterium SCGC AG-343-D04]|nr:transcriptional regulator [Candidatus Marinamargulisbacteria bacterium SCGC AG-343-D04]